MARRHRVVVTGLGVATPIGLGIEAFWDALIRKRCGIRRIEAFDPSGLPSQIAGELPPFALRDFIPKGYRKSVKVMSRDIEIAVVCAYHAVTDAGLKTKCILDRGDAQGEPNVDSRRFGANIGAGLICADLNELASALNTAVDDQNRFQLSLWGGEGMTNITPLWLLKFLPNMLACHVTIVHDAQAPSNTMTCAEASSHLAIGEAFRTIARGDADVCICGGAESKINPMSMVRPLLWNRLNVEGNDCPEKASQPFGADRRGMIAAEGGGLVILEQLEHANARGARIYAEVTGFGAGTDVTSWSQPDPDGRGMVLALQNALSDANTDAASIDLIAPFGTGTRNHDAAEMAAWKNVFETKLGATHAVTTRGALGSNGAGSGAIDFAACVMALYSNTVPPSCNTGRLDPSCRFQFVQDDPVDARLTRAISLGSAMAGRQSGALVIQQFEE